MNCPKLRQIFALLSTNWPPRIFHLKRLNISYCDKNDSKNFPMKKLGAASLGKVTVKVEKYECHLLQNMSIMLQWVSKIFMKLMPEIQPTITSYITGI